MKLLRYILTAIVLSVSMVARGYEAFTVDYPQVRLTYEITTDSTVRMTWIDVLDTENEIDLRIPETVEYNGIAYTVTWAAVDNFNEYYSYIWDGTPEEIAYAISQLSLKYGKIKSLTIPKTIENGNNVGGLYGYVSLRKIVFENPIVDIHALRGCDNLEEVEFISSVSEIKWFAAEITNPFKISLPRNCRIGQSAFHHTSVSEIEWTEANSSNTDGGVIGSEAFRGCTSLREVEIVHSYVYNGAFEGCTALEKVTFSAAPSFPEGNWFGGCTSLKTVEFNVPDVSTGTSTFEGCTALENVVFNAPGAHIGGATFKGCTSLKEIDLRNCRGMGTEAFMGCENLTKVRLPGKFHISGTPFRGFTDLDFLEVEPVELKPKIIIEGSWSPEFEDFISFQDGVLYCGTAQDGYPVSLTMNHFPFSDRIKTFELPRVNVSGFDIPVTNIAEGFFKGNPYLEKVSLHSSQLREPSIFEGCSKLKEVEILPGGSRLNQDLSTGKVIETPDSMVRLPFQTFKDCVSLEKVSIPDSYIMLGYYTFEGCTSLKEIKLPAKLGLVGHSAFEGCSSLTDVRLPENVLEIGISSFANCPSIKEMALPSKLEKIGTGAFLNCTTLKEIALTEKMTEIAHNAFRGCSSLEKVTIHPDSHIKGIGTGAFYGCSALSAIELPQSLDSIRDFAFYGCRALPEIVIPDGVRSLGPNAFVECSGAKSVIIGNGVKEIPQFAFWNCSGAETLEIGENVESIGTDAFGGMDALQTIISNPLTPPDYPSGFSDEVKSNATLIVPEGAEENYHDDSTWRPFTSGIDRVTADDDFADMTVTRECVAAPEGVRVEIYTPAGILAASGTGTFAVNLRPGIYIVRTPAGARKLIL